MRFKYQLAGFDREWVDAGTRREAFYTNLPPGQYTFRVIACNNDGAWNAEGAAYAFYLRPHFYQTWRFYALCAGAALLAGQGVYHWRVKQVKARYAAVFAERNRMARELHDTLLQGFSGIALQLEAVTHKLNGAPQAARDRLERILTQIDNCLKETRRSVWELRSQALEGGHLPAAIANLARSLTEETQIEVRVETFGAARQLPQTVEENLLRIAQEAVTNAVRHAHARMINIEVHFERRSVELLVRDDGCGFTADNPAWAVESHYGLIGMRERAAQLKGRFQVSSAPGAGARISVSVPVNE